VIQFACAALSVARNPAGDAPAAANSADRSDTCGAAPIWPDRADWGYSPPGGPGLIVIVPLVLILAGRL